MVEIDKDYAGKEFDNVSLLWWQWKFPWRKVYSKTEIVKMGCLPVKKLNPLDHLIHADMAKMMKEVEKENESMGRIFSLFIQMYKNSRCQLGSLASQSFLREWIMWLIFWLLIAVLAWETLLPTNLLSCTLIGILSEHVERMRQQQFHNLQKMWVMHP